MFTNGVLELKQLLAASGPSHIWLRGITGVKGATHVNLLCTACYEKGVEVRSAVYSLFHLWASAHREHIAKRVIAGTLLFSNQYGRT